MAKTLKLALVGLGGWGRDWLRIIASDERVRLVAAIDANPSALDAARRAGVAQSLLSDDLGAALTVVDAVLVATSAAAHAPVTAQALAAGVPVLTEKPFTLNMLDASALVALAEQRGAPLMVSQNYRYQPAAQAVRKLLASGRLGAVGSVSVRFSKDHRNLSREDPYARSRHPLLLDMAIHHFDLMRFTLGREATAVSCDAWNPSWSPFTDPACANVSVWFDDVRLDYHGSWVARAPDTLWAGEWRLDTEGGELRWTSRASDVGGDALSLAANAKRPARELRLPKLPALDRAGTLRAFHRAVLDGKPVESSGRDNLGTLRLALAAIESAENGARRVNLT